MAEIKVQLAVESIRDFCRKWRVAEMSLFGSVLTDEFRPDSDADVLVSFQHDAPWSLYEWVDMLEELKTIFGREVDLVEKEALRNPYRRKAIMSSREVVYAA